jgi:hypothetical protein
VGVSSRPKKRIGNGEAPNRAEMGLHHSLLGLADGDFEAFCFAVALGEGGLRAYGAVGVHDHFSRVGRVWFCGDRPGGIWFINGCFHSFVVEQKQCLSSPSLGKGFLTLKLADHGN